MIQSVMRLLKGLVGAGQRAQQNDADDVVLARSERSRVISGAVVVAGLASVVTAMYYMNRPAVPGDPDSPIYLFTAQQVAHGHFVSPVRTPAYPLFLDLVALVAGRHYVDAASLAQCLLFVLAVIGVYSLAYFVLRRVWAALVVTVPVASNVMLVSYVRPTMTEAQALFLLTCLALVLVWFIRRPQPRTVWLLLVILFALGMTRPEWVYFAVPLVGFILLIAWQRGALKRLAPHALLAFLLFAGLSGLYVYGNARHGYVGFGENQNGDLLGKVMQYGMMHEAPPQYAALTAEVESFVARGDYDPWHVIYADPTLKRDHFSLAAEYGTMIIEQHPVEFVVDTIPVVFESLRSADLHSSILAHQAFGGVLLALQGFAWLVQFSLVLFPFIAILWWVRLFRRRGDVVTAVMAGLSLMCAFPLAVTTLFVYAGYARMNAPYDPLMFVVVWCTILWLGLPLARRVIGKRSLAAVSMSVREDERWRAHAVTVPSHDVAPEASAGDMERVPTRNADIAGS